jgi:hypothetical protein
MYYNYNIYDVCIDLTIVNYLNLWSPTGRGVSDSSREARKLRSVSFDSAQQA